ncbi:phytanoyl-CoA dioxygenase family protein [Sphingomonas sinipercae]|uniref:Phytanoyl-CoA dioxygenase family protein n=1 Tax=Sphingomonas sinipercae TaxID=2714944 RepID=A0A6G7ZR15_9SPHN|nr:phytanoyl-CoA dioxygenase family protein [Sphingomonas sinipercae]
MLRWWRAPWWALAIFTGAKCFADNPILGSRRLNRAGLHAWRLKAAHRLAWSRRRRLTAAIPAGWRQAFDRDGFVVVPDFLPTATFDRLRNALLEGQFDARAQQQGDTVTRRVPIGPDLLDAVPELRPLLRDRRWRGLLAYVASTKSEPLYYIQTVAGGIADGPPDPQLELHSDTFHPSLKAWLFLTDVGHEDRPLTYVPGSHRLTEERLEWERSRSETLGATGDRLSQRGSLRVGLDALAGLSLPPPHAFAVPANTLVAVDTYGFHARAASDHRTIRVEIWAFARRTPFLLWTGFDLLSLPPFAKRRAQWLTAALDRLDRLGLAKQHWRPAGRKRPIDF